MVKTLCSKGGAESFLESGDGSVYFYILLGLWSQLRKPASSAQGELGIFFGLAGQSGRWVTCFAELEPPIKTSASHTRHEKKLVRVKGEGHHVTSEGCLLTETKNREWRSTDTGWAHTANSPIVLTSVEDVVKERKLQVCSFEGVQSWKYFGRLSCAVFCQLVCKTVQEKPTFKSY